MTVSPATNFIKERMMRKTFCASILVLTLCGSAFAGDISNPPVASPSPQTNTVQEQATNGSIHGDNTDSLVQITLDLLSVLPSLL
jgi:hypothetical protein